MDVGEIIAIALAGTAAGTINTVVGSGTLVTFPVLLAFGYAPVTANVSNTIGLVPGSVSGSIGYRRELAGQGRTAVRLGLITVLQPRLNRRLAGHVATRSRRVAALTPLAVYITGVYGGYFGAGQGILLLAIFGVMLPQSLHRSNALKNVLAGTVNGVAGVYFVFAAHVEWAPAAIIAVTSIVGAQIGARYGRRLHPNALRALIVVVGVAAIVDLLVS
jgi:uncharacterized protein